jgi:drug/metabolite transporter (DMT)-like permease
MNLQFLWMVAIGAAVFGEVPGAAIYLGAALVISAGAWLIYDQAFPGGEARKVIPAE